MATFGTLERRISWALARTPRLRGFLKRQYQWLNYRVYGERGFRLHLEPGVALHTPSSLAGVPEPDPDVAEFFGYFDTSPWSPDGRHYVTHQVSRRDRHASIIIYDFEARARRVVAQTPVWTWQQGAMARWIMVGGKTLLAHNGIEGGLLGTHFLDATGGGKRFIAYPMQAINDSQACYYAINYSRLHGNGTEYGYAADARNMRPDTSDEDDGIWRVDPETGDARLIVSIAALRSNQPRAEMSDSVHEVNHISVAPDGVNFVFIHRYRGPAGQFSRLYVARHDGSGLRLLLDDDMVSHYAWRASDKLVAWARTHEYGDRYYLIDPESGDIHPCPNTSANQWGDGHPTCHPDHGWIATDSYPDRKRQQHLFLMDPGANDLRPMARFLLPMSFTGAARIDLHPRWSPDGQALSIDAAPYNLRRNYIVIPNSII